MPLLVTSASGANGDGFGALLAFESDGRLRGTFIDDDRITDPRGLAVDPKENLLFLNSGADRVLAISSHGRVVRDTGRIEGLNPGGGNFGPDGRYYVGLRGTRTIIALSTSLDGAVEQVLPPGVVPFPRGFGFGQDGRLFLASGIGPNGQGDNTIMAFTPALDASAACSSRHGSRTEPARSRNRSQRQYRGFQRTSIRGGGRSDDCSRIRYKGRAPRPSFLSQWKGCVPQTSRLALFFQWTSLLRSARRGCLLRLPDWQMPGAVVQLPRLNGQALVLFPE